MRFQRIEYRISFARGQKVVSGYAVACDLPVKFCVRKIGSDEWVADHYNSGLSICRGMYFRSRTNCGALVYEEIKRRVESGEYYSICEKAGVEP